MLCSKSGSRSPRLALFFTCAYSIPLARGEKSKACVKYTAESHMQVVTR
jgi:hypothetical protein